MRIFVVFMVLLLTFGLCSAQMEQRIPSKTLFFISFPNLDNSFKYFQKTALSQLLKDEEIKQFFCKTFYQPISKKIKREIKKAEQKLKFEIKSFLKIFKGEFSLAIVKFDPSKMMRPLSVIVTIEYKDNQATVKQLLSLMSKRLPPFQKELHNGYEINFSTVLPVCYALVDKKFVFSNNINVIKDFITPSPNPLSSNPYFKRTKSKVQKGSQPLFFAYVNINEIYKTASLFMPLQAKQLIAVLKANQIQDLGLGVNFCGKYIQEKLFLGINDKPSGITKILKADPISNQFLKMAPKNATSFSTARFNLQELLTNIEQIIETVNPGLMHLYNQKLSQVDKFLGIPVKEVISCIGNECANIQYMPLGGGLFPRSINLLQIKNLPVLNKCIKQASKLMNLNIKELTYKGKKISYFSIPPKKLNLQFFKWQEKIMKRMSNPLTAMGFTFSGIAYYIDNDVLYYAYSAADLKSFIDLQAHDHENLTKSSDFQYFIKKTPDNFSFMVYYDFRSIIGTWLNSLAPILRFAEGYLRELSIPFDSALLPRANTICKYIVPGGVTYTSDKEGFLLSFNSTLAGGTTMAGGTAVVAAVAIPGILRARASANESLARGTLRSIATAQSMFQVNAIIDQDQDGSGEYGYIQELAGTVIPRGAKKKVMPYIYSKLGHSAFINNGIAMKNGYCYHVYLPGDEFFGMALPEKSAQNGKMKATKDTMAINGQEYYWICYAWPAKYGNTGRKAFIITQGAEVYYTDNKIKRYSGFYNIPKFDAAFDRNSKTFRVCDTTPANDGQWWMPHR